MKPGKVYLVGAGPGDPGLITGRALDCLARARVLVYDHLVGEQLLDKVAVDAEKIYVGKSAETHAMEQDDINRLLVEKALQGKTVVRLKGGDPFVLGRGGEEAEFLWQNQIPFEVIPGISSAVAVPCYAGIPVTYRGLASSFAVITGHEDPGKEQSSINWPNLATGVDTLVFLMGMANLPQIANQLVKYGRQPSTPVAVICNGTEVSQQTLVGTLADIGAKVKEHGIRPPAVIVVGEVVKLREKLQWFENRPLFGKRVLVTRSRRQAGALSQLLYERGARPVEVPVIEIQPVENNVDLDKAVSHPGEYDWLVFTSANGVKAFFQHLQERKLDSRQLKGVKIGAIGPATADELEKYGLLADYMPRVYTSEGFVSGLKNQPVNGLRFLLLRADIAGQDLAEEIVRLGGRVDEIAIYRTISVQSLPGPIKRMLLNGEMDVVTFTSSSTVTNLVRLLGKDSGVLNRSKIACIGPVTAAAARKNGLRVDILAGEATIPGLVDAIENYFRGN